VAKALEAANQNRELTAITHGRYAKMYEGKAISRQEMDQFESRRRWLSWSMNGCGRWWSGQPPVFPRRRSTWASPAFIPR